MIGNYVASGSMNRTSAGFRRPHGRSRKFLHLVALSEEHVGEEACCERVNWGSGPRGRWLIIRKGDVPRFALPHQRHPIIPFRGTLYCNRWFNNRSVNG